MAIKDVLLVMISFATFIVALLSYIAMTFKRK